MAPGFQSTQTSSVSVAIYSRNDDPIYAPIPTMHFNGSSAESDSPSVISVSTTKNLGKSAGTFTVAIKVPSKARLSDFADDDWIDISFHKNGVEYHTMRGLIENITKKRIVNDSGATSTTYVLQGKDFGCVFEKTEIWYNYLVGEVTEFHMLSINDLDGKIRGNPAQVVERILFGFMKSQEGVGRANWLLAPNMPGAKDTFPEAVLFDDVRFSNVPERDCSGSLTTGDKISIWDMALEYADPMFCDLICDLGDGRNAAVDLDPTRGYKKDETAMRVQFRDKIFPTTVEGGQLGLGAKGGLRSTWFNTPVTEVNLQDLVAIETTKSTHDRFNSFVLSPSVVEAGGATIDTVGPLWDKRDIRKHGLRQFDVQSRYFAADSNLYGMAEKQRLLLRDWHAIGPYLSSGGIVAASIVPGARVGTRLRVKSHAADETFYIEGCEHSWTKQDGGNSTFQVTRGWEGTDKELVDAINSLASRYTLGRSDVIPSTIIAE